MSTSLSFVTVDVFTSTRLAAGNPLAIVKVPSSTRLSQDRKQLIAREFNYSETVFLHERDDSRRDVDVDEHICVWEIDIFTTDSELPFAGHPTIGTACHVLSQLASSAPWYGGQRSVIGTLITKAGKMELQYFPKTHLAKASIPHEVHVHQSTISREQLSKWQPGLGAAVERNTAQLPEHWPIVSIVKGMAFALISLDSLQTLGRVATGAFTPEASLDAGPWHESFLALMFYVRLPDADVATPVAPAAAAAAANDGTQHFRTRMIQGPLEDPATGSASAALAAYLTLEQGVASGVTKYGFTQGVEMGRKSEIGVEVTLDEDRSIKTVDLVGGAVQVMEGRIATT
ncbi:Diaminopimelate epimerase-like protein [Saccharata proteae CBS 121410]|uniref:Diaminopimelate epimerase-like protein n=1 Tax=Saccharata proteae CBS 121410 TaxID=1314787 RepID=A0A9P4HKF3_9PEZI|nr:Diaminopimelate epimerase-like protein [Saccharata proteae CBS 121410]